MGFFKTDAEIRRAEENRKPSGKGAAKIKVAAVLSGATGCDACALKASWPRITSPKMRLSGNTKDPDILVLGDVPSPDEDRIGAVWSNDKDNAPGRLLHSVLPRKHLHRLAFQDIVRCSTITMPTPQIVHACSVHLKDDIERLPFKAILGVGALPFTRMFPGHTVTRLHGLRMPVRFGKETVWFYGVTHPNSIIAFAGDKPPERTAMFAPFQADIKNFFDRVDGWEAPVIPDLSTSLVQMPKTEEDAAALLDSMQEPVAIDFEGNSLSSMEHTSTLYTVAFSDGKTTCAFPLDHPEAGPEQRAWAWKLLRKQLKKRWLAQTAAMELRFILTFFPDMEPAQFDDTQALARLVFERETAGGLDEITQLTLGVNVKALSNIDVMRILEYPLQEALTYNGLDALGTRLAYDVLIKRLRSKPNYRRLMGACYSTTTMELMGLPVNQVVAQNLKEKWQAKAKAAQAKAATLYEAKQFQAANLRPLLLGSNDDVGTALVLYGKASLPRMAPRGGKIIYSTKEPELLALNNPLAQCTLDHREATKMVSTYIDPIIEAHTRFIDKQIHPKYTTLLTRTARLSSEDPNIQNFPKRDAEQIELRMMIEAIAGHILVAFDYGQLEARIIAMASRDRNFIRMLLEGYDVHAYWRDRAVQLHPEYLERLAQKTGETDEKRILKSARDIIKTDFVFASFYGSTAKSVSARTGIPIEIVEKMLRQFWKEFNGVHEWIKARRREYSDTANVTTLTGRVRHAYLAGNETINNPIQGTAADIVTDAMNDLALMSRTEKDPYLHPRVNIHDDLMFMLPNDDRLGGYIDRIQETMVKVRYDFQVVPLIVESKLGLNWRGLEEFAVFTGDYVR